ncbi:MAG: zinc-binding dehydrogenase [Tepidisphaerales bacterium]
MIRSRAIVYTAPYRVELQDVRIPPPEADEYLVETVLTAISPGTELRNLSGKQEGVAFPTIGGYLCVGRVIGRGPRASAAVADGTLVFCSGTRRAAELSLTWGGHVAHAVTPAVFPVPAGLSPRDAVLCKLAAIAYRGVRLSRPEAHERVAVVGLGPIGQFSMRCHALRGCRTVGFDLSPERVAFAKSAGGEAYAVERDLASTRAATVPQGFDVVVDATGVAAVLPQSLTLLREKPWDEAVSPALRLLVQGSYPGDICLPYMPCFRAELAVLFPRDNQATDIRAVLELAGRGRLTLGDLVSEVAAPSDCAAVYDRLAASKTGLLTAAFDWTRP